MTVARMWLRVWLNKSVYHIITSVCSFYFHANVSSRSRHEGVEFEIITITDAYSVVIGF